MSPHDLLNLVPSWRIHMTAINLSPHTVVGYTGAITKFLSWCADNEVKDPLTGAAIERFSAATLTEGAEPATARMRHYAIKAFAKWLVSEGEVDTNPFIGVMPPKDSVKVVPALTDDQMNAMIKACKGQTLKDRRDEAILRFMFETGVRASELTAMRITDVSLPGQTAIIHKGKGAKGRVVPFSATSAAALDRYLRARKKINPDTDRLWINPTNHTAMAYPSLIYHLKKRAAQAGVDNFYPHKTRHTAATRWLRRGGSEAGLMAIAGWSTRQMIDRYTAASAAERAVEEAKRLDLGT